MFKSCLHCTNLKNCIVDKRTIQENFVRTSEFEIIYVKLQGWLHILLVHFQRVNFSKTNDDRKINFFVIFKLAPTCTSVCLKSENFLCCASDARGCI